MEQWITDALILRENNNLGESDRFITALTRDLGIVRASVRGAQNVKNKRAAATRLLTYSRLTLIRGRDKFIVGEAEPQEVFFALREDVSKLALAQYFCELAMATAPTEEPAGEYLTLILNALHFLSSDTRPAEVLKGIVELRLLALSGYMPDAQTCHVCGRETQAAWLSPEQGHVTCRDCPAPRDGLALSAAALTAVRYVLYGSLKQGFSFALADQPLREFSAAAEACLLTRLQRRFPTLEFYHTVK